MEWVKHEGRNRDGEKFIIHQLFSGERLVGWVDYPMADEVTYEANPEIQSCLYGQRSYRSPEAAKSYCEEAAREGLFHEGKLRDDILNFRRKEQRWYRKLLNRI